jgi:uncharacterized protein YigA (DUF484 family)
VTSEEVASFLRAHPDFLAERPELYGALTPPDRRHGNVADHMAAMVRAGRHEVARVLEAGRARQGLGARVGEAVLALLRTVAPLDCVAEEWPALLAMESVRLLAEGEPRRHLAALRPGEAAEMLPGHRVLLRAGSGCARLHGEAAALVAREALIPVRPGLLLVLGAREAALLPAQTQPLAYLGRALAARLQPPWAS